MLFLVLAREVVQVVKSRVRFQASSCGMCCGVLTLAEVPVRVLHCDNKLAEGTAILCFCLLLHVFVISGVYFGPADRSGRAV